MSNVDVPILYGSRESGHAYKVKLALNVLGIAHEYRAVNLRKPRDQRQRDFLDVSPYGEVPVLIDSGVALAQSNAILDPLERVAEHVVETEGVRRERADRRRFVLPHVPPLGHRPELVAVLAEVAAASAASASRSGMDRPRSIRDNPVAALPLLDNKHIEGDPCRTHP